MIALALAYLLNSPVTASAAYQATVALETMRAVQADRHVKAERLGEWLNKLDGERIRSLSVYSPFSDDGDAAVPFEDEHP